ncbi:MAG: DUF2961 domain-containing protein [Pirellulales bacterium]|nr:DUF2961 domain-containing protein [Pirellulales bacterium]
MKRCIIVVAGVLSLFSTRAIADSTGAKPIPRIEDLYRLDLLPQLRQFESIGCKASYDPTGGNDDGFSGKYSVIRKEKAGLVVAEFEGPGVVTRIHMSQPTQGIIKFFFDGEETPRIQMPLFELFSGKHAPFLRPLIGTEAGGRYSYVPLPFRKSCKIVIDTKVVHFFQINHAKYPKGTKIATYEQPAKGDYLRALDNARKLLGSAGTDISSYLVPKDTPITTQTRRESLGLGKTVTLFETSKPGRIVGLRLTPAHAFAGSDRDVLIKMYWDGNTKPAVCCPVGDFFGYSFGEPAGRSLLLGTAGGVNYAYFPMPYERSARIELVSERKTGLTIQVEAEVEVAPIAKAADEGRFYAHWRRENPTTRGVPYTFLKTTGQGHVVGVILQAQGLHVGSTGFFEGDDLAVIDGKPVAHGTGSEETFNGGWYDVPGRWEDRVSLPLSGCLEYKKYLGRTGGYRWMIADAYPYRKSIDFTIEHGPEGNRSATDYTSVTYFYSLNLPALDNDNSVPPAPERRVIPPKRIVFSPGWSVPIRTFSLHDATLSKKSKKMGDQLVRYLDFSPKTPDTFGRHHISFLCDMPADGRYRVSLKALLGPDQGTYQLYLHDRPIGKPVDLYAPEPRVSKLLPLGELDLLHGDNPVFIVLTGKAKQSTGHGLNAIELVFKREK